MGEQIIAPQHSFRLFDSGARAEASPRTHNQGLYEFLNTSAWPQCDVIRTTLESWFAAYPEQHAPDLQARFRSPEDTEHQSALFELYMHTLLQMTGCGLEVHPALPGINKTPDFSVREPSLLEFVLEATVVREQASLNVGAQKRRNRILDTLNQISAPDFLLHVEERGIPITDPKNSEIRLPIEQWLSSLQYDPVRTEVDRNGLDSAPTYTLTFPGYEMHISAVPIAPEHRGLPRHGAMASCFRGVFTVKTADQLRNAINDKATRYGKIGKPFIVAVNVLHTGATHETVFEALFGKQVFSLPQTSGSEGVWSRSWRGAFYYGAKPVNTRLSGVLIFNGLHAWSLHTAFATLYLHPGATTNYSGVLSHLPTFTVSGDGAYARREGKSVGQLLNLPADWLPD